MGHQSQPVAELSASAPDAEMAADTRRSGGSARERAEKRRYGKVAKRGVVWSFARESVTELITLPAAFILARQLSPFDFGVAASAAFFLTLGRRLTNFGFNLALARVKELRPEHSSSVFVVSIGIGTTAFAVLAAGGPVMAAFFRAPQLADIMPIAALSFLIAPLGSVPAALMSRDMRFKETAFCDWIQGITSATTSISLSIAGFGYWSLIYNQVVGDAVGTTARFLMSRWRPSLRFSASAMKELFSFGSGIFVKRLLDYGAGNLDNLVIGRVLGLSALGFYDKGFMMVRRLLSRLNTGGPVVSFRVLSLLCDEPERFNSAYGKVVLASTLLSFPMLFGLAALGPDLIPVAFGPGWEPTVVPFQILCVAGAVRVLTDYAGSAIQAMGRIWGQVGRQVIQIVLMVVLVALLASWGLPGAAFGVFLATLLMYVLMQGLLIQLTAIRARTIFDSQLPGMLCAAAVGLTVWGARLVALDYAPSAAAWERLIVEVAAGGLAYLAFIKFNRFQAVRRLVRDTADDLAPPLGPMVRLLV